jgi:hypothetical protein
VRHDEVHEDDVGLKLGGPRHRLLAIGGLTDDLDAVLELEERAQALAHHRVVVDDHDADRIRRHRPAPPG